MVGAVSCVQGHGIYNDKQTFELAVINDIGKLDYSLTDGDVLCYQTIEDLITLIKKVATIIPTQKLIE